MIKTIRKTQRRTRSEKIVYAIVFVIFVIYSAYLLLPFAFCFNASLKENGRAFIANMISIASPPHFKNYITAFSALKIGKISYFGMLMNSVIYSTGCTLMGIFSSSLLAYAIARYDFKLKKFLYALALFVMMIPIYGSLPASYKLLSDLGFINSWFYLLSTANGFGFNFLIIYSFFQGISREYSEAATIDGAGHFRVMFTIMFPMAIPSVMAIVTTSFIGFWNDYSTPLLFLNKMYTLSSGLWMYERNMEYTANHPIYFAGVLISLIPIIVFFLCFQNTIMEKVYAGGLKG